MSKSKKQGTGYERVVRMEHRDNNLEVVRLAEEGSLDLGDLSVGFPVGRVYVECKFREGLTVHGELGKAKAKAGTHRTVLFWKRLVKVGNTARRPIAGQAEVVVMDKRFYYELMGRANGTYSDME